MTTNANAELAERIALRLFVHSLAEPITVGLVRDVAREVLDGDGRDDVVIDAERLARGRSALGTHADGRRS